MLRLFAYDIRNSVRCGDAIVILVENGLVPSPKRAASGAFWTKAEADFQVKLLYTRVQD